MSEPAIISERERHLFRGSIERHDLGPFAIVLYWEPHYDSHNGKVQLLRSFTVDLDGGPFQLRGELAAKRWRFKTLAAADAWIATLKDKLAVEIAMIAFRIN